MNITIHSHPQLWDAIEFLYYDNGVDVPEDVDLEYTEEEIASAETALQSLSHKDFEEFVAGDEDEQHRLIKANPKLLLVNEILTEIFEAL